MTKKRSYGRTPDRRGGVQLKKPLERTVRQGHPWLFRDALAPFDAAPGATVRVLDRDGRFLAVGLAEAGPIGVRVFSLSDEPIDDALFTRRVREAFAARERIIDTRTTDAYRLIHGEGDALPGFVCDRYGRFAVLKLDGDAALAQRERMLRVLQQELPALGVAGLLVRSGKREDARVELAWGERPDTEIVVREHGMRLRTNLFEGQKTGLFLDHRESRARVRSLANGARVLNLYGYTGGFSVAAGLGGASEVTTVDIAKPALALAAASWRDNDLPADKHRTLAADAIEHVTAAADGGERYELVIADPPNFAPRESARESACRAYEALHTAVLRMLAPGAHYLAASCSSHITRADFEATLAAASGRTRRRLHVLERSGAPADHPKLLGFPEGDYLKVCLLRVAG
jgi:23S rRNA (cytosine1962-C5)-methyltransferase